MISLPTPSDGRLYAYEKAMIYDAIVRGASLPMATAAAGAASPWAPVHRNILRALQPFFVR